MNLLKVICIISFCLKSVIVFSEASNICVNSTANYKMFGSVRWADYLNTSFEMAFQDEKFYNYIIKSAKNESELVSQVRKMTQNECLIILGLFTSQDCLMTGKVLVQNNSVALSSSCSNEKIKRYFPHIYSMTPEQIDYSRSIANYIIKDNSFERIFVFYQPSDIFSRDGLKLFKSIITKKIIPIEVKSNGDFNLDDIKKNQGKSALYVFFTYPLPSVQVISKLDQHWLINKDITIIGGSSWIYQLSVFHSIKPILAKTKKILAPNLVDKDKVNLSSFKVKFEEKFHRKPDVVEILTYDATRIAVQCYRYAQVFPNIKSEFIKCLYSEPHDGISGQIHFSKDSPFAKKEIYMDSLMETL